jgi:hypothetical protein
MPAEEIALKGRPLSGGLFYFNEGIRKGKD